MKICRLGVFGRDPKIPLVDWPERFWQAIISKKSKLVNMQSRPIFKGRGSNLPPDLRKNKLPDLIGLSIDLHHDTFGKSDYQVGFIAKIYTSTCRYMVKSWTSYLKNIGLSVRIPA